MAIADSISVFAEGTFEEQTQELVNYIARTHPEGERAAFIRPFQDLLRSGEGQSPLDEDQERRMKVVSLVISEVKGLGDGSDREIEGFFNLLYSQLFSLFADDSPALSQNIATLAHAITTPTSLEQSSIKYRVLSNLFNTIPRRSPLRLNVCKALLQLASQNDELEILQLSLPDVERWLREWKISTEEKSDFLQTVANSFYDVKQPTTGYSFELAYARSIASSSLDPTVAANAALHVFATALKLPSVFDFDTLLKLEVTKSIHNHPLYELLEIYTAQGLTEYKSWEQKNAQIIEENSFDKAQLERKMRLLVLSSLGFKNVGRDVPYSEIASILQIDEGEVEKWVIDVIRAGLLSGKLSQATQSLHITRSSARIFGSEQWNALEKRLVAWKAGLAGVMEVVTSARQANTPHISRVQGQVA